MVRMRLFMSLRSQRTGPEHMQTDHGPEMSVGEYQEPIRGTMVLRLVASWGSGSIMALPGG